mmetsp:Transcript_78282/g.162609  ORF Transcript_78282/g.162609 Transcript_78282/m.162609 type:complete len:231 (-) Transcript_78282:1871-2563(-)
MVELFARKHSWTSLSQASCDAIRSRFQCGRVDALCLCHGAGSSDLLELGEHPLEELLNKLPDLVDLPALAGTLAEQAPGLEGQVPHVLVEREVEDKEEGLRGLLQVINKQLAQLLHEGVNTADGALEILELGGAHEDHLHLAVLALLDRQTHLLVVFDRLHGLLAVFLGGQSELLQHQGQDVREEWQEGTLHDEADALGSLHHVLHDGVVGSEVGHVCGLDHGLHDDFSI